MWMGTDGGTQRCEALARKFSATAEGAFARPPRSTPLGSEADQVIGDIFRANATNKLQKTCKTSGWAAVCALRGVSIRKKIIGHRMRDGIAGFASGKQVRLARGAFAFLQKETRKSCVRVVVHPLIKQGRNLLADIGGMRKTRELKALQRILGSREKKLPRGLGRTSGHMTSVTGTLRILSYR